MYQGQTHCEVGTESHGSLFRDSRVTIKQVFDVAFFLRMNLFPYNFIFVIAKPIVKWGRKATGLF